MNAFRKHTKTSTALICLFTTGAAGVWFAYLKTGPQRATAAIVTGSSEARVTPNAYRMPSATNVMALEKSLKRTATVVARLQEAPAQTPVELRSNPFRRAAPAPDSPDAAIQRDRQEARRQSALKAVQALQLQSVYVTEKNRSCMINNGIYIEGQQIDPFVVERIAPASVIVRTGVYRFELKTQR